MNPISFKSVVDAYPYKYSLIFYMIIKYVWEQYVLIRQLSKTLIKTNRSPESSHANEFYLNQAYQFDKLTFKMLGLSIKICLDILKIMANVLPFIWENVEYIVPLMDVESEFQRAVGYVLIEAFLRKAFMVPLEAYEIFVIEKKYKLSSMTLGLYIYNLFVQSILILFTFSPIIYGYLRLVQLAGSHFFFYLPFLIFTITIFKTWIYPNIITPFLNELKPIKNQQLKIKIQNLSEKTHFPLENIKVKKGHLHEHTSAEYHGYSHQKVIVIYDTLLQKLNCEEITGVVAHEIGHWQHWHSTKSLVLYLIENISLFYIYSFFVNNQAIFLSFGFKQKSIFVGTAMFFELFEPLTYVFEKIRLIMTRIFEFQADSFSCRVGYGSNLKAALIKLDANGESLSTRPDKLYSWLNHSHPTLTERIQNINMKIKKRKQQTKQWLERD